MEQKYEDKPNTSTIQPSFRDIAEFLIAALKKEDLYEVTNLVSHIRRRIDSEKKIKELISTGIMKQIIGFLDPKYFQQERLLVECSEILSCVNSTETLTYIIHLGSISKSLSMLKYPNNEVKQNFVSFLANIAGDSLENRDILIEAGVVKQIMWLAENCTPRATLISKVSDLISNLVKWEPFPRFNEVKPLRKIVAYYLKNMKKKEITPNVLWAFANLTNEDGEMLELICSFDTCPILMRSLKEKDTNILFPALRAVGNLRTGSSAQEELLLKHGVLEAYSNLLGHPNERVYLEIYYELLHLLKCDNELIRQILEFKDGGFLKNLAKMQQYGKFEVVREVLCRCDLPRYFDTDPLRKCLNAINNILDKFNGDFGLVDRAAVLADVREVDDISVLDLTNIRCLAAHLIDKIL